VSKLQHSANFEGKLSKVPLTAALTRARKFPNVESVRRVPDIRGNNAENQCQKSQDA
jgi:hypothetical protein